MPSSSQLWHIYHVENCRHTTPPKHKYVVVVHLDEVAYGCFINSRISNWLQARPNLLVCEAQIPGLNYPGINYDSWVDCQQLYEFTDGELNNRIDVINDTLKADILNSIHRCPTLSGKHKKAILTRENWPPFPPTLP